MGAPLDEILGRACAHWIDRATARPLIVVWLFIASALVVGFASFSQLGIDSNEENLFHHDPSFLALRDDYRRAFPDALDPIVVVIDASSSVAAGDAVAAILARLDHRSEIFGRIYDPAGGRFFDENGLLYLEVEELDELTDELASVQPLLAELSQDASLRGLLELLNDALEAVSRGDLIELPMSDVLGRLSDVIDAATEGRAARLAWSDIVFGSFDPQERRRYLLVQPVVDYARLRPAEDAILALREAIDALGYDGSGADRVRARITGLFVLSYEEAEHVSGQAALAGAFSFVLVALVLVTGLGSLRIVGAALLTLIVGLAFTAGFAAAVVGHLNLISVAFVVLYIGLSIDFGIHMCVRYRELALGGAEARQALRDTGRGVGASLVICAITTAVGFYAFVPTDYRGVGELGLIGGSGTFISLFANLTLLPALLMLFAPPEKIASSSVRRPLLLRLVAVPVRNARLVLIVTAFAAVAALYFLPRTSFDPNPLRVRDPSTESVQTFNDLLAEGRAFPWNVNAMAADARAARALAERLAALPSVDHTLTLTDFVPDRQEEKLAILADANFLLGPALGSNERRPPPSAADRRRALDQLAATLAALDRSALSPDLAGATERLEDSLSAYRVARLDGGADDAAALAGLEARVVDSLPEQLDHLATALGARRVAAEDLPRELVETMVAADGRVRIEVVPKGDLNDNEALERYVSEVLATAPAAFGEGVAILETGRLAVRAFRQALSTAGILIALLLLAVWRNPIDAGLVALPLVLAALFTAASTVAFGVPLNFANVIVIPLLLGLGVDSGIHLVHRMREATVPKGNLLATSTARAVLLSALTTVASFGTLGASTHLGLASLGRLLVVGMALILLCTLVVLPALSAVRAHPERAS
jgi:hopanoid biosynthesis associated RND transporter like protein HpnN